MPLSDPPAPIETTAKALVSLVPVFGSPALVIWEDLRTRVLARMELTATEILDEVGADDLARRMAESPEFEALVVNALENAGRTGYEPKRRLLGRVVINAALDMATIDRSQLIALTLRDLEAPHVRALERIRIAYDTAELIRKEKVRWDERESPVVEWGVESPEEAFQKRRRSAVLSACRKEPDAVIATLLRTGVAIPAAFLDGGLGVQQVSKFGRELLDELRSAASD